MVPTGDGLEMVLLVISYFDFELSETRDYTRILQCEQRVTEQTISVFKIFEMTCCLLKRLERSYPIDVSNVTPYTNSLRKLLKNRNCPNKSYYMSLF